MFRELFNALIDRGWQITITKASGGGDGQRSQVQVTMIKGDILLKGPPCVAPETSALAALIGYAEGAEITESLFFRQRSQPPGPFDLQFG